MSGLYSPKDIDALWDKISARKALREQERLKPPRVRLWDGDFNLRGECVGWRSVDYEFIENDTGSCTLQLSLSHYLAKWVMNFRGRFKRNVLITLDKQGSRWSGIMDHYTVKKEKGGDCYLEVVFKHDYEQVKHIFCWANPFLRPELQFPKLWLIFGPAKWCLMMTLFVNIFRLETSLWTLPDNPLDPTEWMPFSFNQSNWRNIVRPFPLFGDTSPFSLIFARFKSFHDVAKKTLEDAELTMTCRRYIKGEDPHPFLNLSQDLGPAPVSEADMHKLMSIRNGCLVWDIVDNSARTEGTSFGGSTLTGLKRGKVVVGADGTTEGVDIFTDFDPLFPGDYFSPWYSGTKAAAPWVVFEEGPLTGIESSEFTYYEATDTSFLTGGHSMPGINEAISSGINMAGDFLTSMINNVIGALQAAGPFAFAPAIDLPPLGGVIDAIAKIFYEDVFLAFMEVPTLRAASGGQTLPLVGLDSQATSLGDFHYYEGWGDGADRAFTLAALVAIRAKMWATRTHTAHKIKVSDAAPYLVGEEGFGHFWLGNRVGTTVLEYPIPHTIFVDRVQKIRYTWDQDGPKGWQLEIGYREPEDPALKALEWIRDINQALGVFGIL